jgi:hypothetical protein
VASDLRNVDLSGAPVGTFAEQAGCRLMVGRRVGLVFSKGIGGARRVLQGMIPKEEQGHDVLFSC